MFYYYDNSFLILIPAMLFAFFAQMKVSSAYGRFAQVKNQRNMTGAQAARMILDRNGLRDVRIEQIPGRMSDHYDPRSRVMRLSQAVYNDPSIASVSIAAHESGHAIQHANGYVPLSLRNAIAPVVSFASNLAWPLLIIGLLLGASPTGSLLFDLGVLFFAGAVVFQAITLPVEFNASSRAISQMEELGIVYQEEVSSSKKMLSAAAMTYVAALAVSIANLLRILAIRGRD